MKKPKMYNKPNPVVKADGKEYWISRSVAVMCVVIAIVEDKSYVLMNKRGKGCPEFRGCWNCPCGYLDWNESAFEAVVREVWEETGVNIKQLDKDCMTSFSNKTPWHVNSDPLRKRKKYRQNVTLRFGFIFYCDSLPDLSPGNQEKDEVSEISWVPLPFPEEYKYAFGHDKIVKEFLGLFYVPEGLYDE